MKYTPERMRQTKRSAFVYCSGGAVGSSSLQVYLNFNSSYVLLTSVLPPGMHTILHFFTVSLRFTFYRSLFTPVFEVFNSVQLFLMAGGSDSKLYAQLFVIVRGIKKFGAFVY